MVKTQTYLGITIDEKLNSMAHVANIRAKMARYTLAINSLSRKDWGLSGEILKLLYKRGLERIVIYMCGSWWTGAFRMLERLNLANTWLWSPSRIVSRQPALLPYRY